MPLRNAHNGQTYPKKDVSEKMTNKNIGTFTTCMIAYRSSVRESTGSSPNELMLGREIEVPLHAVTELPPDTPCPVTDNAQALHQRLAAAHECARQ